MSEELIPIKARMTSVFYRRPSPEEPPFVEVGSKITDSTVVCLLEVMKCYSSVLAGVSGTIEEICVESGQLVKKDMVLFLVRPDK